MHLQREIVPTKLNNDIILCILQILEKDNEINAKAASKVLNELIKLCQSTTSRSSQSTQTKQYQDKHIITLFEFLEKKTKFLANIGNMIDIPDGPFQQFKKKDESVRRNPSMGQPMGGMSQGAQGANSDSGQQGQQLQKNQDSLNYLSQIPHTYVYTMAYIESTIHKETHQKIKESIQNSITNIMYAL